MPKYLKMWQGVTSGTPGGREDGFPETKYAVVSMEVIARTFGKQREEKYFLLQEVELEAIEREVNRIKEEQAQRLNEVQLREDEAEYERLKKKLGK